MNYEEKYKQALERARKELRVCGSQDCDAAKQIFRFFPELVESKDERIKRTILELVSIAGNGNQFEEIKDWLEKQGGQKHFSDFKAKDWYVSKVDGKIHNIYQSVDKVESKKLDADKVIAWLVANIIDFEYYVKLFKKDFKL